MTNTEIVKGMYEAFNRGDITPVLNSLSDNVEWIIPGGDGIPFAGRYRGRDGVAGFFRKLAETSDTDPIQVDQYVEQGDVVVNDPSARPDAGETVRKIYPRKNVAAAWQVSHRTVYFIYPESAKIPADRYGHWETR